MNFPMFVDLTGKKAVVIGAGNIARRRIGVLKDFGAEVTVIAPEALDLPEGVSYLPREYQEGDLQNAYLAVAATNCRQVNHLVKQEADSLGIPVSVADCKDECTFFFPAICRGDNLIAGVVSDGTDHHKTARAARAIRSVLEDLK